MPLFRPRISLLTALLLTTIAGMAIAIVQLWREVGPLRAEVSQLRNEVGRLTIDDPKKLHAIQVETNNELIWKWRVWVPANRVFAIHACGSAIPSSGFPSHDRGTIWLRDPGEQTIEYRIRRDPRNENWYGSLRAASGSVGKDQQPWVEWPSTTSSIEGVGAKTKSVEPDQSLLLTRHRVSQSKSSADIEDPSAGFMIWMEPSK